MKRWAKNIFCLFSLLVFVGSVTLWLQSYSVWAQIAYSITQIDVTRQPPVPQSQSYNLEWSRGTLRVTWLEVDQKSGLFYYPGWAFNIDEPRPLIGWPKTQNARVNFQFGGFELLYSINRPVAGIGNGIAVGFPLWLCLPAGIPPLLWWRKYRRRNTRGFPVGVASSAGEFRDREDRQDAKG